MTVKYLDSKRISALGSTDKETIALDTRASESNSGTQGTTMTLDVTIGTGSKRALFVCLNTDPNVTVSHIKLDGVAFTEISGTVRTDVGKNSIWQLINPASGTGTITVTWGASAGYVGMSAISFTGVDQTTPVNTSNITSSYVSTGGSGVQTVSITPANTGSAIFGYVITQRNVLTSTGSGSIASTFLPKGETSSTLGGAGFSQYDLSPTIGSANNLVVYTHNTATTNQDRVIIEINAGTLADVKPTNVQDNSILVEKDTGNRYWKTPPTVTFQDDFSTSPNGWTSVGSTVTISSGALRAVSVNTASDDRLHKGLGFTLSNSVWVCQFEVNLSTSNYTNLIALTDRVSNMNAYDTILCDYNGSNIKMREYNGSTIGLDSTGIAVSTGTQYYVTLTRTSPTELKLEVRTDSHTGALVGGSAETGTINSGTVDLNTVQSGAYGRASGSASYVIDNLKIYNNVSSLDSTWILESPVTLPSGLTIWYDFSDVSTITKDSSNRISVVADKTSNGFDLVQATGGAQPLWVANDKNSLGVIDFAGSRYMASTFASMSNATGYSIVLACVVPADNNTSMFSSTSPTSAKLRTYNTGTLALENSGSAITSPAISGLNGSWRTIVCIGNGSSSKVYIDGIDRTSGTVNFSANLVNWLIGAESTGGGYSNAKQGELIAYNRVLSATEISDLHTYLKKKWGI